VLSGVGTHEYDLDERRDRSPWVVGTIVRPDQRGQGIGQALMARCVVWTASVGIEQVWVATERAAAIYERCGFEHVKVLTSLRAEPVTILTRRPPERRVV
jgi:N-acetylglutamate synthase-like GNAT family acetyltransferase